MCLNFNAERFGGERMLCNMHGLYWFTTGTWLLNNLNVDKLWMTSFLHKMVLQGLNTAFLSG